MAISRMQQPRQLLENGGILTLEDAKRMAPPGESLAYINKDEAKLLKSRGGAGEDVNGTGIKSYFIKKIFKKAKRVVKKVAKSKVGKAALAGAALYGLGAFGAAGAPGSGGFLNALRTGGMQNFGYGKNLKLGSCCLACSTMLAILSGVSVNDVSGSPSSSPPPPIKNGKAVAKALPVRNALLPEKAPPLPRKP